MLNLFLRWKHPNSIVPSGVVPSAAPLSLTPPGTFPEGPVTSLCKSQQTAAPVAAGRGSWVKPTERLKGVRRPKSPRGERRHTRTQQRLWRSLYFWIILLLLKETKQALLTWSLVTLWCTWAPVKQTLTPPTAGFYDSESNLKKACTPLWPWLSLAAADQSVGRGGDGQADGNRWDTSGPFPFPAGGENIVTQGWYKEEEGVRQRSAHVRYTD